MRGGKQGGREGECDRDWDGRRMRWGEGRREGKYDGGWG